jgi:hypothetical protein
MFPPVEEDAHTGTRQERKHALDDRLVSRFIHETCRKFHGVTQGNPLAPTLYRGWWKADRSAPLVVDDLTFAFGLVRVDQADEAIRFFREWKRRMEGVLHQDVILLMHYPVQVVGDFF